MRNNPHCSRLCRGLAISAVVGIAALDAVAASSVHECLIEPNQVVQVSSPVEGLIEKIFVRRGDKVTSGQPLVQLESRAENSAVRLAKYRSQRAAKIASSRHRFDYLSKKFERTKEMVSDNFLSVEASDAAKAEMAIAEWEMKEALEDRKLAELEHQQAIDLVSRRVLRSPFAGVVVDRMLNPGDLAEAGTGRRPILKLAMVDPLRVEVVLPVEAYGKLQKGMKAQIVPEGIGGRFPAKITVVDSVFDSASGTFGVQLELPNPNKRLPAGIRCKIELPIAMQASRSN